MLVLRNLQTIATLFAVLSAGTETYLTATEIFSGIGPNSVTTLNSSPGMIKSPDTDGDGLYDYSVDLLWIIEAPDGYIIKYQIPAALIKNSAECHKDGLKVGIEQL